MLGLAAASPHALILGAPLYDATVPRVRLIGRYLTHGMVALNTLSLAIRDSMCGYRVYPLTELVELADGATLGARMEFDIEVTVRLSWGGTEIVNMPTPVTYPADGVLAFQALARQRPHQCDAHAPLLRHAVATAAPRAASAGRGRRAAIGDMSAPPPRTAEVRIEVRSTISIPRATCGRELREVPGTRALRAAEDIRLQLRRHGPQRLHLAVVDMQIRYARPLRFGDESGAGNAYRVEFRLRIDYAIHNLRSGERTTKAMTTQVAVELATGELCLRSPRSYSNALGSIRNDGPGPAPGRPACADGLPGRRRRCRCRLRRRGGAFFPPLDCPGTEQWAPQGRAR